MHQCRCSQRSNCTGYVHYLNNRGCVSIINGNYLKAIDLLEIALKKYKQISDTGTESSSSPIHCSCDCERIGAGEVGDLYEGEQSSANDSGSFCENSAENDTDAEDCAFDNGNFIFTHDFRINRITTTSQLRTVPFPGQEQERHEEHLPIGRQNDTTARARRNHRLYHQVYKLPIVMNEQEWKSASRNDICFVLIFNNALCNQLLGMALLEERMEGEQWKGQKNHDKQLLQSTNNLYQRYFTVARGMYQCALESLFSFVRGVDKIYYVAIFNNISHVCKTLEGYDSHDAFWYDQQLLKSIYWWKDCDQKMIEIHSQPPPPAVGQTTVYNRNPTNTGRARGANTNDLVINDRYEDNDFEIIDAFLENVFYLMCAGEDRLPAPVA